MTDISSSTSFSRLASHAFKRLKQGIGTFELLQCVSLRVYSTMPLSYLILTKIVEGYLNRPVCFESLTSFLSEHPGSKVRATVGRNLSPEIFYAAHGVNVSLRRLNIDRIYWIDQSTFSRLLSKESLQVVNHPTVRDMSMDGSQGSRPWPSL